MLFKTNNIIGHRGCSLTNQNNTIEAFLKAVELGAEMVEMDIRKTKDDVLVVWHDMKIEGIRIRGHRYQELAAAANDQGKVVPMFEEILKGLEGKTMLDIELKEGGYEELVVSLILKYFTPSEFVITSFMDSVIANIKAHFPTVQCGLILGIGGENELAKRGLGKIKQRWNEIFPWRRLRNCHADFLVPYWKLTLLGLAKKAFKKGIPVFVWTINEEPLMRRLMRSRYFNGIITDRTDLAIPLRRNL